MMVILRREISSRRNSNWQQYNIIIKTYLELADDGDPSSGDKFPTQREKYFLDEKVKLQDAVLQP